MENFHNSIKRNPGNLYFEIQIQNRSDMLNIKKTYVTDEKKRLVAVQIDIKTFEKIEQVLEDYALVQLIDENDPGDNLSLNEAKSYYDKIRRG